MCHHMKKFLKVNPLNNHLKPTDYKKKHSTPDTSQIMQVCSHKF